MNDQTEHIISPPKYEQLRQYLTKEIRAGRLRIGTKLEAEDDLAKRFGISRGTVRQALQRLGGDGLVEIVHGKGTIVRRRIAFTQSKILSFVFTESGDDFFSNEFFLPILATVFQESKHHGLKILFTSFTAEEMEQDNELFLSYAGNACIIARKIPDSVRRLLHENKVPFVLLGNLPEKDTENAVIADNFKGARIATNHLVSLGHKRIAHIEHDMHTASGTQRLHGYVEALRTNQIKVDERLIIPCDAKDRDDLYRRLDGLRKSNVDYTAVFASSDHRAMMAMDYFRERGVAVPRDVSVIGFDNLAVGASPPYSLTTIDVDKKRMGVVAVEMIRALLDASDQDPKIVITDVSLIERTSCWRMDP